MTDDEKILRFAGFTVIQDTDYHSNSSPQPIIDWWVQEDNWEHGKGFRECPDTADLTWLFKWCVPKLLHKDVHINAWSGSPGYEAIIHKIACEPIIKIADTPGEALRAAILALIEMEGK